MKLHLAALLSALVLVVGNGAFSQGQSQACALLTADEIGAAVGGQAGPPQGSNFEILQGPSKGETISQCAWLMGEGVRISVGVVPALQGAMREAGIANLNRAFDALKAQGRSEERSTIGNTRCLLMTPPAAQNDAPRMTACLGDAKGMALSVGATSPARSVAIEPIKALFDKAIARVQ